MTPRRFKALDGWRGVCAILVATYHYPQTFPLLHFPLFSSAWVFVDFFFVLSGFVVYHRYLGGEQSIEFKKFVVARFKRLYPLHAVTAAIALAVAICVATIRYVSRGEIKVDGLGASSGEAVNIVLAHMMFVQGFASFSKVGLNIPSWSVSVEFWTNIAFAAIACANGLSWRVLFLIGTVAIWSLANQPPELFVGGDGLVNGLRSVCGFVLGIAGCKVRRLVSGGASEKRLCSNGAEIACVLLVVAATLLGQSRSNLWLLPIIFSVPVLVFSYSGGVVSRIFEQSIFRKAAELSFAIYLVHPIWLGLFYNAGTLVDRLSQGRVAVNEPQLAAVPIFVAYVLVVWWSAAVLTKAANQTVRSA